MDIIWMLKDLIACKGNIQEWVNRRYRNDDTVIVRRSATDCIVTPEGLKFGLDGVAEFGNTITEYEFSDIRSDDVVLDLGANVGFFSIYAAQKAKHVYAVEPLFYPELYRNIARNHMQDKITVMRHAIGAQGKIIELKYRDRRERVITFTLQDTLAFIPEKVTFLKIDIEGAEWGIPPQEFDGIRRIEFEAHGKEVSCMRFNPAMVDHLQKNWNVSATCPPTAYGSFWIHAYPKEQPKQ